MQSERELRERFARSGTFVINAHSSPGSGKATLLEETLRRLSERYGIAAYRSQTRARLIAVYAILVLLNAGAWGALLVVAHRYPLLLALGVTAYVLGLRHAVDPDHIAAIDRYDRRYVDIRAIFTRDCRS